MNRDKCVFINNNNNSKRRFLRLLLWQSCVFIMVQHRHCQPGVFIMVVHQYYQSGVIIGVQHQHCQPGVFIMVLHQYYLHQHCQPGVFMRYICVADNQLMRVWLTVIWEWTCQCGCHRISLLVGPVDSPADKFLTLQGEFLYPH